MNEAKLKALQKAGFQVGTVGDFLGLGESEYKFIQLKYRMSTLVRRIREHQNLTQQDVAHRIESSQSRIAKIEAGTADVSLDLMFRYLFAVGGDLDSLINLGSAEITCDEAPARKVRPRRKNPLIKARKPANSATTARVSVQPIEKTEKVIKPKSIRRVAGSHDRSD